MSMNEQSPALGLDKTLIDEKLPTPLYHQIYLILRDKIINGSYANESVIPSEHELGRMFDVSRITAKRALDELAVEGLVTRHRGRGTRVSYIAPAPPLMGNVEGLLKNLTRMGEETQVDLLEFNYGRPPAEVAMALGLNPDDVAQRAVRVRRMDGNPFSYLITYVPEDIGASFTKAELSKTPMLALLQRAGAKVASAEQTISATLADTVLAPALDVGVGAPLLRVTRVVHDQNGRPVQHITAYYRPDRYQLQFNLQHGQHGDAGWSSVDSFDKADI